MYCITFCLGSMTFQTFVYLETPYESDWICRLWLISNANPKVMGSQFRLDPFFDSWKTRSDIACQKRSEHLDIFSPNWGFPSFKRSNLVLFSQFFHESSCSGKSSKASNLSLKTYKLNLHIFHRSLYLNQFVGFVIHFSSNWYWA